MKYNKPGNDLTDQMKNDLKDVKTKEELDALVSSAGFELDDDELDAVAGGECEHCSCLSTDGGFQDSNSGGMGRKK